MDLNGLDEWHAAHLHPGPSHANMSFGCPYLPSELSCGVWQPCKPSQRLVSMPVAARSWRGARSAETECGRRVLEWVGAGGAESRGDRGGGSQSTLLAFTGSAHIPKFFSNLQLLDVEANHQRGSPRAYLPYPPPPTPIHAPPLPIFSPSGVPSHSSLFTYSCVYLLFHRLCLSWRGI